MKKLIIKKVDNYVYTLVDENNTEYNMNIEFYDLVKLPNENDIIYMEEKLLRKINNQMVSFGALDGIYGKSNFEKNDEDLICLKIEDKTIYLKRFYG